jgi:hypothetical protein
MFGIRVICEKHGDSLWLECVKLEWVTVILSSFCKIRVSHRDSE